MTPKNLISLCMLSCLVMVLSGFESEKNLKTQRDETSPSLLSFVDMNRYTLVLSDPTTRDKAKVNLKTLPYWPGPMPEHTLILPDAKKVFVTYMGSATEPVGIAVRSSAGQSWSTYALGRSSCTVATSLTVFHFSSPAKNSFVQVD